MTATGSTICPKWLTLFLLAEPSVIREEWIYTVISPMRCLSGLICEWRNTYLSEYLFHGCHISTEPDLYQHIVDIVGFQRDFFQCNLKCIDNTFSPFILELLDSYCCEDDGLPDNNESDHRMNITTSHTPLSGGWDSIEPYKFPYEEYRIIG